MKVNLQELIPIQREVNLKIKEKLTREIRVEEFILAFNIEFFEFFNEVGLWKWWKHSHKINKDKILDELADCFAFFLSIVDLADRDELVEVTGDNIIEAFENDVNQSLAGLSIFDEVDYEEAINNLIILVGAENETADNSSSIVRFAIAIYIGTRLFPEATWEDLVDAYKKKSGINIERQVKNY